MEEATNSVKTEKVEKKKKKYSITVKANKKGRHIMGFLNVIRVVFIPLFYLIRPFRFYGNRRVKDGAAVYVCNHYGLFDITYVASTTWEGLHFLGKKEVFDSKFVGFLARKVKTIGANRDGNDVRALLDCFKCLKNGEKVVVFPEGTRNKTNAEMLPFKHGASAMAIKAKAPIIPVVIYKRPKLFCMTHILIDDPMELSEYYDRKLTEEDFVEADNKLRNHMLEMRRKHTEYLENKKKKK